MNASTPKLQISVKTGHIDDADSMLTVCQTLAAIHGSDYHFDVVHWQGQRQLTAPHGRQRYLFVIEAKDAYVYLAPGQRLRGIPPEGPYLRTEEHWATVTASIQEEL